MIDAYPATVSARRFDWRFLLPVPHGGFRRLVLLGGTDEVTAAIRSLGLAREVSLHPVGGADALVVLHTYRGSPLDAVRSLDCEGVLYWEVERRHAPFRSPATVAPTSSPGRLAGGGGVLGFPAL